MTIPKTVAYHWLEATEHVADVEAMCAEYLGIDADWAFAFCLLPIPFHDALVNFAKGSVKRDAKVVVGFINKKIPAQGNVFDCKMVPFIDVIQTILEQPNYVVKSVNRSPEANDVGSLVIFAPPSLREPQHAYNQLAKRTITPSNDETILPDRRDNV